MGLLKKSLVFLLLLIGVIVFIFRLNIVDRLDILVPSYKISQLKPIVEQKGTMTREIVDYNGKWTDGPANEEAYSGFKVIKGFFEQDEDNTDDITYPLAPKYLGLLDKSDDRWAHFHEKLQNLKNEYKGKGKVKFILFCRHGQGFHNEAESKYGTIEWDNYYSKLPEYFDPHLTELGKKQLVDVYKLLKVELQNGMPFPFIISSPHVRTLETTTEEWLKIENEASDDTKIGLRPIVSDDFRETYGEHTCDSRRSTTELIPMWPSFDFTPIKVPDDVVWKPDSRETPDHVLVRVRRGMAWVFENVDSDYVSVVGHSGIMTEAMRLTGHRKFSLKPGSIMPLVVVALNK